MGGYIETFLKHHSAEDDRSQYEFIFIENSGDADFKYVIKPLKDAGFNVVLINTHNYGFGEGCNTGAEHANGEILIFANPDICFLGRLDAVKMYFRGMNWGTVRQLISRNREYSFDLLPEYKGLLFELFRLYHFINPWFRFFLHKSYVVGSFLIVSKALFIKSGGFDKTFFLYYEEVELARRLQNIAGPPLYESKTEIYHRGFGSNDSKDKILVHEARGFLTYCQVTKQPKLLHKRMLTLRLLGIFSSFQRRRLRALKLTPLIDER